MFIVERMPRKTSRNMQIPFVRCQIYTPINLSGRTKCSGNRSLASQLAEDLFDQCFHLLPYFQGLRAIALDRTRYRNHPRLGMIRGNIEAR